MRRASIQTVGDLAARDVSELRGTFGSFGPHLYELAQGRDPREVIGDWQRKSYGEENTFEHDLEVDGLDLKRALLAHAEAIRIPKRLAGVCAPIACAHARLR
jgi:DNA polymerase-4